jgi:hypothetical protein
MRCGKFSESLENAQQKKPGIWLDVHSFVNFCFFSTKQRGKATKVHNQDKCGKVSKLQLGIFSSSSLGIKMVYNQCYGSRSGSGTRSLFDPWIRDPE